MNQMNWFLAPAAAIALAICVYALIRFRKACVSHRQQNDTETTPPVAK
ncbi:hypothetical protein HED60_03060 [Planctomycetales bacterium ZRK34]|nr:hypothetical protein HED60_03060 [Planctomycetales bacterium ZRK34]